MFRVKKYKERRFQRIVCSTIMRKFAALWKGQTSTSSPQPILSPYQSNCTMTTESHPLKPFLPSNGRILFLGSFPPPRARWSMEFFYPNFINDFWRIMGLIHFHDAQHFVVDGEKRFCRERIIAFCMEKGLAFYDTATQVRRLKGNASDEHLEIVEPTDIGALLGEMPLCNNVVTTGGKASEELQRQLLLPLPRIGEYTEGEAFGRTLRWWRMPSSSRAYPLKLEKKADFYARLFNNSIQNTIPD